MSDDLDLTTNQVRSMWRRLASSPYITPEERHIFTLRAAAVADTRGEVGRQLDEAIERERARRRSGALPMRTLPPHAPQQQLDDEERELLELQAARQASTEEYLQAERAQIVLPPGTCVSHSLNAAAHVVAATAQAEHSTYAANAQITPLVTAQDCERILGLSAQWSMRPVYGWPSRAVSTKDPNMNEIAKLIGSIFSGGVTNISYSQRADGSQMARLNVEIALPADLSYDDVMENMHRLAGAHSVAKATTNTGRRRLLKLEEVAE